MAGREIIVEHFRNALMDFEESIDFRKDVMIEPPNFGEEQFRIFINDKKAKEVKHTAFTGGLGGFREMKLRVEVAVASSLDNVPSPKLLDVADKLSKDETFKGICNRIEIVSHNFKVIHSNIYLASMKLDIFYTCGRWEI